MSNNVSLSDFDRGVSMINTYNSFLNRKISEQILVQLNDNNAILVGMENQLRQANETNRRILENQIREIKNKEQQKFYKALSFNINEIIEQLETVDDPMVLQYLVSSFYEKTKNSLILSNDVLEEINDKLFIKQILERLNLVKQKANASSVNYSSNVLSRIDYLLLDLNEKIRNIPKKEYKIQKITDKRKTNILRFFGISVLGLFSLVAFSIIFDEGLQGPYLVKIQGLLFFIIPLLFLLKKEIKWRKGFEEYKKTQNQKRENESLKKVALEKQQIDKIETVKREHPAFIAMQEINLNHPIFESITGAIANLEINFQKKWGISFNNTKNSDNLLEKVVDYLGKGQKLAAIKTYKAEKNVTLQEAKKKVDEIERKYI